MGVRQRTAGLLVLLSVTALAGAAWGAGKAKPLPTNCPNGQTFAPEGHCSRCEFAFTKARDACGDARKGCAQKCEGAYQKCLRDPRALNCDKAQETCTATCDKSRTACFSSKEKAYSACRAKEPKRR